MKKLRAGVIGVGMGRNHVAGFQGHPQTSVVAIADLNPDRLREVGDEFHVPGRYTSAEAMLAAEGLDVVGIATPNNLHKPLALKAFKAGCHVLCEKPMALNAAEGRQMLAAARRADRRLMINFSYRFTATSQALKAEVDKGMLGEVYFARSVWHRRQGIPWFGEWFTQKALSGGGPLIDLGVHRTDLALWLMGYPRPTEVMGSTYHAIANRLARANNRKCDVEDLAAGVVKFDNGATLVVEASWAAHIADREMMKTRLLGTRGGLVERNRNGEYAFEAELHYEKRGRQYSRKIPVLKRHEKNPFAHFADCILRDLPHTATGEEGLVVMEILDALYKSAATNRAVRIPARKSTQSKAK